MLQIQRAYLNTQDGERIDYPVFAKEEAAEGVTAIFLEGTANRGLDPDFGAGIDLTLTGLKSWMADYRYCEYWCRPAFGKALREVPKETQGFIYEKEDGGFGVLLPVVSESYKCVLAGNEEGGLTARLFSWYEGLCGVRALALLAAEGENPYSLLQQCVRAGLKLLGSGCRTREERRYPEIFEYLGWCSWDALEIRINEEDLLKKCTEFKEKEIPVKWAILDDMWAYVRNFYDKPYDGRPQMFALMHSSPLTGFRADPVRFPQGLSHCIGRMKEYGLKIGIWYPTTGYWRGIEPGGEAYEALKSTLIHTADGAYVPDYRQDRAYLYYDACNRYLRQSGADFVKIDNQSMTRRFYKGLAPVGEAARSFHGAMEAAAGQHFDSCMINCMGMASEDMWNRSVSPVARCSDDFLPENRDWFVKHILQCSFNCLIQGQFYYCDWDMWWTDDGQAVKNSLLRAVSGGPVYISDPLFRSRKEILQPLTFSDGRILRCDRPGMPARDCLTSDPTACGRIFKIQNTCGESGVIAAFNLDAGEQPVSGSISPSDVEGLQGERFAVYEHFSRSLQILNREERMPLRLKNADDFRLYAVVPLADGFAAIGRTDKYIAPRSVKSVHQQTVTLFESGEYAYVKEEKLFFAQG